MTLFIFTWFEIEYVTALCSILKYCVNSRQAYGLPAKLLLTLQNLFDWLKMPWVHFFRK